MTEGKLRFAGGWANMKASRRGLGAEEARKIAGLEDPEAGEQRREGKLQFAGVWERDGQK